MEERGDAHGGGAADPSAAAPLDRAGSGPEAIVWRELSVGAALEDGRFVVQRQIGHGGAGMVYEAIDRERDGARVAIKTLRLADPEALYHLKNEFRSLGDVAHPNLVRLRELSNDAGCWFVAMDLVRGVDFCAYARGPAGADRESITDAIDIDGDPTLLEGDDARQGAAPGAVRRRGSAAFDEARLRAATAQLDRKSVV